MPTNFKIWKSIFKDFNFISWSFCQKIFGYKTETKQVVSRGMCVCSATEL